jgi:hypothetical protein
MMSEEERNLRYEFLRKKELITVEESKELEELENELTKLDDDLELTEKDEEFLEEFDKKIQEEIEDEEEEEVKVEDYKIGREDELYVSNEIQYRWFVDHEKKLKWKFGFIELAWPKCDEILNQSMKIIMPTDGREPFPDIDIAKTQRELFFAVCVESPFANLKQAYYRMPIRLRNWILSLDVYPDVGYGLKEKEQGK